MPERTIHRLVQRREEEEEAGELHSCNWDTVGTVGTVGTAVSDAAEVTAGTVDYRALSLYHRLRAD